MNLASSWKNSQLNARSLLKGGEYGISIGRLMASLQQIQLVLWILLMSFQNPIRCGETACNSAEEEETGREVEGEGGVGEMGLPRTLTEHQSGQGRRTIQMMIAPLP